MNVLGIESSCDETAAAVVSEDGAVLSDVVASQVAVHAPYGGVVPELASRAHMTNVVPVIERAVAELPRGFEDVDAVAVTQGPGLVGALLVGLSVGKALAFGRRLPLVGVNHLDGHLFAVFLRRPGEAEPPEGQFVALLASGGHTALYRVGEGDDVRLLGQTRDDAAGEAYDKAAKLLGLGYPGGPVVDRLAAQGNPHAVRLPMPMLDRDNLDFSFAGLKTALVHHVREHGTPEGEEALADLCASFQHAVVEVLVRKSVAACQAAGVRHLVLTGGVAANRGLRARAAEACAEKGLSLHVPPPRSCTDNAAMIAYAGVRRLAHGHDDGYALKAYSRDPSWNRGRIA
jgi:N6-L-threonylcarbamoyladenine synthase